MSDITPEYAPHRGDDMMGVVTVSLGVGDANLVCDMLAQAMRSRAAKATMLHTTPEEARLYFIERAAAKRVYEQLEAMLVDA